jgi:uncharacterized protein
MSNYFIPNKILVNPHVQTWCGSYLKFNQKPLYSRRTLITSDNDFLDIDEVKINDFPEKIVLVTSGLEGSSDSSYARRITNYLKTKGISTIVWNYRGCSGRPNVNLKSYHSGYTDDLRLVIKEINHSYPNAKLYLLGYSVGGNIILKYLGEEQTKVPAFIHGAIAVSPPCDLQDCALTLSKGFRRIYMRIFLRSFYSKLLEKKNRYPELLKDDFWLNITDFESYDNKFIAPWFGFTSARDYWQKASCKNFIPEIRIPTTIITSSDDPFFTKLSIPISEVKNNRYTICIPEKYGGHVGYFNYRDLFWLEEKIYTTLLLT